MKESFICTSENIQKKLKTLLKTGTDESGWIDHFIDGTDQSIWTLTRYRSDFHGGGTEVLKKEESLSVSQLINLALTSAHIEDVIGASLELYEQETHHKKEFRDELLNRIELLDIELLDDFDKKRLETIIYESSLYDSLNLRSIIGKSIVEIEQDALFYKRISDSAKSILTRIKHK